MSGLGLNLAGADLKGSDFDPIPSGTYLCEVVKMEMKETKGGADAKLPKGTPMINVRVKVVQDKADDGSSVKNRNLFRQLVIAPAKVGGKAYEHKGTMDRILGQFFVCLGYSEEEIKSGNFNPEFQDSYGKQLLVVVGQKKKYGAEPDEDGNIEMDNEVKGFKPLDSGTSTGGSKLL